ncbi:MAG: LuxR C-terminal-related transcriptional regulator [Shewanella sp.]|nr:LuxR C-terminal-related transcriptional regulator [Shewanella sp.]
MGELWFSRYAMSHAFRRLVSSGGMSGRSANVLGARYELSAREQQVFTLLLQGSSNKDIASQLNLTTSTVKTHVSNILSKTGKSSRSQLSTLLVNESAADVNTSFCDCDHTQPVLVLN